MRFSQINNFSDPVGRRLFTSVYNDHGMFNIEMVNSNVPSTMIMPRTPMLMAFDQASGITSNEQTIETVALRQRRLRTVITKELFEEARDFAEMIRCTLCGLVEKIDIDCINTATCNELEVSSDNALERLIYENMEGMTFIIFGSDFKDILANEMLNTARYGGDINNINTDSIMISGTKCIFSNSVNKDEIVLFSEPKLMLKDITIHEDMMRDVKIINCDFFFSTNRAVKLKIKNTEHLNGLSTRLCLDKDIELSRMVEDIFGDKIDFRIDDIVKDSEKIIDTLKTLITGGNNDN